MPPKRPGPRWPRGDYPPMKKKSQSTNPGPALQALRLGILAVPFVVAPARAQLIDFSRQQLVDYSESNPFDRLPDGRPKVPDNLLRQARELSAEEIWAVLEEKGYKNQYADGFRILHPDKPT